MTLVTYDLIVNDKAFRSFVYHRIAKEIGKPQYCFPSTFPLLYRYRSLSEYAVSDIINDRITLSAIGDFNDLYDGTIPLHGTTEQRKRPHRLPSARSIRLISLVAFQSLFVI